MGTIRRGTNLMPAYFDQQREQLDPGASIVDNVTGGSGDTVIIDGQPRHVSGYLRDFLFPPERLNAPVSMLSGGERNRLLLARLFAKPSNLLIMDEPTNDLDAVTLEAGFCLIEAEIDEVSRQYRLGIGVEGSRRLAVAMKHAKRVALDETGRRGRKSDHAGVEVLHHFVHPIKDGAMGLVEDEQPSGASIL